MKSFQQSAVAPDQLLALVDPFLFSNSSEVKRDALHGLASLAKTEENKENIGNVGGVSALASLIFGMYQGGNQGNRMKTIGSSSSSFATERTARKKEKNHVNQPDMIRIAAETLSNLLTHPSNQEKFFLMQGIEKSIELCFLSTKSSIKRALTKILFHLTNSNSRNRKLVLEARGSQGVFKLLSKVDEDNNVACFMILKKLSSEADLVHKWEEDIIQKLTGCLRHDYGTKCCAIIALTIANIMEASSNIEGSEQELFKEILFLLDTYNHVEDVVSSALHCLSVLFKKGSSFDAMVGSESLEPLNRALNFQVYIRNYGNCKKIIESILGALDTASVSHFTTSPLYIENLITFVKTAWKKDVRSLAGKLLREIMYKVRDEDLKVMHSYGILSILLEGTDTTTSLVALEILAMLSSNQKCFDFCIENATTIVPKIDEMSDSSKLESVLHQPAVSAFLLRLLEHDDIEKFLLYEEAFGYTYLRCLHIQKDSKAVGSAKRLNSKLEKDPESLLAQLVTERDQAMYELDEEDIFERSRSATRIQSHWRGYKTRKSVNTIRNKAAKGKK
ncbi:hypothetical protein HOP50_01g07130 [Chloropicon primus]|uniref:Uncharacterized protein n=1 Tax=Chloropicon primus TaxID=1764295 RepID=A0A5B8MDA3_9CHLO|nr:hypothetical protein A3770_01p07290 [Chloropicon primus]UPQ97422.1 hypothetical protein HOP50_01g07130 [Chloropicon primus]|eukprot:QDZ18211.1 hypothetical protein A3770_01p07290 [Chloropicon primus]